jgi:hypothetical protein
MTNALKLLLQMQSGFLQLESTFFLGRLELTMVKIQLTFKNII